MEHILYLSKSDSGKQDFFLIWGFVLLLSRALRDGRNLNEFFFLLLQMKLMNRRHHDGLRLRLCFSSVCYFIFRYFASAVKSTYTNTLLYFLTNADHYVFQRLRRTVCKIMVIISILYNVTFFFTHSCNWRPACCFAISILFYNCSYI